MLYVCFPIIQFIIFRFSNLYLIAIRISFMAKSFPSVYLRIRVRIFLEKLLPYPYRIDYKYITV